ncbi:hypothetical protein SDD30_15220 [Moorella naiadis]|uniref:hypothetical protein n=1 Tax=Moorella naiadis (nom. illeg.) TaxID=3093670 RepID=UPI003D9C7CD0
MELWEVPRFIDIMMRELDEEETDEDDLEDDEEDLFIDKKARKIKEKDIYRIK